MKKFKAWFNRECNNGQTIYLSSYDDCERAWKAALRCVGDEMLSSEECEPPMEIIALIKDELNC